MLLQSHFLLPVFKWLSLRAYVLPIQSSK